MEKDLEKDQWLMASANTAIQKINSQIELREAKAAELAEMIKEANVVEWDIKLITRVLDLILEGYGDSSSQAEIYRMGYMCGERAERKRREVEEA